MSASAAGILAIGRKNNQSFDNKLAAGSRYVYLAWLALLLAFSSSGCSTVTSFGSDREDLRNGIRSGTAVTTGDRVRVTTVNGTTVVMTVTSRDSTTLSGNAAQYIPDTVVWGGEELLVDNPDQDTIIKITIGNIISLVDEESHARKEINHAANALMLAAFGFLLVFGWIL